MLSKHGISMGAGMNFQAGAGYERGGRGKG